MSRRRWTRHAALAASATLLIAACSDGGDDGGAGGATTDTAEPADTTAPAEESTTSGADSPEAEPPVVESTIDWQPCDDLGIEGAPVPDCATVVVPLDHSDPDGPTIELAVARIDTAPDDEQLGHVVFNPGGPGGSGLEFLEQAIFTIPVEVQDRFDLVSFDPRGVGSSTAVECDVQIDDNVPVLAEGDDEGWQALVEENLTAIETCTEETVELGPRVGTNNAARDLDLVRVALGDPGLTYVGYSYGTRLGATYAELFPENVRALVLDAAVKPDAELAALALGQAEGFDRALTNFAEACDADTDCLLQELGPTLDVIEGLRAELDEIGSIPAGDDRILTRGELDLGIIAALYSKDAWPFLAQALYLAETEQDGELLQVLGDGLQGRQPDGTYDNSNVANGFINCADDPTRPAEPEVRANAEVVADRSEFFDEALRANTGCLGIDEAIDPLIIGPAEGAPPILVIGSSGDPATPFEWSVELSEQLDSGVLFTVEAEGHTAYGSIECVTDPVNGYLIDLVVPAELSCSDNASADFFLSDGNDQITAIVRLFDCLRDNGADIPEISAADVLADQTGEEIGQYLDPSDPAIADALLACTEEVLALQETL